LLGSSLSRERDGALMSHAVATKAAAAANKRNPAR
jgi:hypothetical protein